MRAALVTFAERRGVITRSEALREFAAHVVDDALADGALIRLAPMVYAPPSAGELRDRLMAGLLLWRLDAAISHTDGLALWELPTVLDERVHLTAPGRRPATNWPTATLHRRQGFE